MARDEITLAHRSPGPFAHCAAELYQQLLEQEGVEVYNDAVTQIRAWRAQGIRTAIVSSSKNCAAVLWAAGLTDRFEVRVDGLDAERLGLVGKPAPDIFLEAARQLGIEPRRAVVIEDALAEVRAGRNGGLAPTEVPLTPDQLKRAGGTTFARLRQQALLLGLVSSASSSSASVNFYISRCGISFQTPEIVKPNERSQR